ncbi:hypothetical protein ACWD01_19785 [Streptomyces sp. NPDC002835]
MTAYATAPDGLVRWTERVAGVDDWEGPEFLEAVPGWTGNVTLAQSREGYVHFVALRQESAAGGGPEVVVATQFQTGRGVTPWRSLGIPASPAGPAEDVVVSGPMIVVNQSSGSVHVIVSLRNGGIVRRSRNPEGAWGGWKSVAEQSHGGELAVVMPERGPLEILVAGQFGADRWIGAAQGRFNLAGRSGVAVVEGTAAACETGPKRATYFWRYPGDGSLVAWRPLNQQEDVGVMPLGGAGGRGAPGVCRAMVDGYDCTVLAQPGAEGGIEVTAYVTENEGYGVWWAELGGPETEAPQMTLDCNGGIALAAIDEGGSLHVTRQDPAKQGLAFGPWECVG